jgi:SAM-dependent methyltransferase
VSRYHVIAERDHELQNPTTPEKLRLVGELLRLRPETRVLDLACGRGGPAVVLASSFGCRITGVEREPAFVAAARTRVAEAGLDDRVEIVQADARAYALSADDWDVALCLGATFVWDGLPGTLNALVTAVGPGGRIAVGEPYWRTAVPAPPDDLGYVSLSETVVRFEGAGLAPVGVVAASLDDWDRYESLHWRAVEEWLAENPDDPYAAALRREHDGNRCHYLEFQREHLGWAILVGRKAA